MKSFVEEHTLLIHSLFQEGNQYNVKGTDGVKSLPYQPQELS
jgi:hypothetical protein